MAGSFPVLAVLVPVAAADTSACEAAHTVDKHAAGRGCTRAQHRYPSQATIMQLVACMAVGRSGPTAAALLLVIAASH